MGKSPNQQHLSPTSKTGEKLRGRKRAASVLQKAWATRRRNKAAAKKREGNRPSPLIQAAKAIRRGSTKPIRHSVMDALNVTAIPRSEDNDIANAEAAIAGDTSGRLDNPLGTVKFITDAMKHGDEEAAVARLLQITARANFEGQKRASDQAIEQAKTIRNVTIERAVTGFIAEVQSAMARHGGLPAGQVWTISSFTITKIVDALTDAGYTTEGFRKPQPVTRA